MLTYKLITKNMSILLKKHSLVHSNQFRNNVTTSRNQRCKGSVVVSPFLLVVLRVFVITNYMLTPRPDHKVHPIICWYSDAMNNCCACERLRWTGDHVNASWKQGSVADRLHPFSSTLRQPRIPCTSLEVLAAVLAAVQRLFCCERANSSWVE